MRKIKGIIDRFEGNIAVVEVKGKTQDFDKAYFPEEAAAGDIVEIEDTKVTILADETENRKKEIENLMKEVWEDK